MSNHGDDCYFFYYSTCVKGDECPFRHCEAAMGSEVVCNLWQNNCCFRKICKFRHMEIQKNRKEIPCYWEHQPAGCQKPHCAFHHEKARVIDGVHVPPDKASAPRKDKEEEPALVDPAPTVPAPLSNPTNPQLRGVMKTETLENVPSPTHPPVVINPTDDDEDEDDQYSEGEDSRGGSDNPRVVSPRKPLMNPSTDEWLNVGVRSLEEIRLRKALKANLRKAEPVRRGASERLGKRDIQKDILDEDDLPVKCRLAERLGKKVDCSYGNNEAVLPPQKGLKPVRERLGLQAEPFSAASAESRRESTPPEEIRIKTLEEIRLEKAGKIPPQESCSRSGPPGGPALCRPRRADRASPGERVKTFSEVLLAKKMLEQQQMKSAKTTSDPAVSAHVPTPENIPTSSGLVTPQGPRVKTLEEIRREKAARSGGVREEEGELAKRRIIRIVKPSSPAASPDDPRKNSGPGEKSVDPAGSAEPSPAIGRCTSGSEVKVKTFDEIMREKKLRRQQEEQAESTGQSEGPVQSQPTHQREKSIISIRTGSSASVKPPPSAPPTQLKAAVRQRIILKSPEPAPPPSSEPHPVRDTSLSLRCSTLPAETQKRNSPSSRRVQRAGGGSVPPGILPEEQQLEKTHNGSLEKSPGLESKVRPKLNVKPSVMTPTAQVKLGQKRKATESHKSAVAAIKPLSSIPAVLEEGLQMPPFKCMVSVGIESVSPAPLHSSEAKGLHQAAPPHPPPCLSPSRLAREQSAVRPSVQSPAQTRTRRLSHVSSRAPPTVSSAVDDFDELMNEFTDDRLEDELELDPGKGEEDLLLELSEMIDS